MSFLAAHAGSYPRVGDTAEFQVLRKTIDLWEKKKKSDSDLAEARATMTRLAVEEQLKAGLDIVTDGQIRWYDSISHLLRGAANVEIGGLLRFFDTNSYFRQPTFKGALTWEKPITVEDFSATSKLAKKTTVKSVLTGPFTLAAHSLNANVSELAAYVASEVAALVKAGATLIQIDEPSILKNASVFNSFAEAISVVASKKGKAKLILATWWGDATPLLSKLMELPVDGLAFDLTYSSTLADALASTGSSKLLQLGIVDGRNTKLEKARDVAKLAEHIGKKAKADVHLAPSCGLEYLPRDRAFDKLKVLGDAKNHLRG